MALLNPILNSIVKDIRSAGGRVFLVGGCVRDTMLGLQTSDLRDFDLEVYLITHDTLLSILSKYGKPNLIGKAFGVIHLMRKGIHYDFSFPRKESKTGEGHKAFAVQTNPEMSFEEAALRRDFTINAMGMELPAFDLCDPYNGKQDLQNKILRHVSGAFSEDSLRVLRGVQFAARFELNANKETIELCKSLSLNDLSRERIEEEFRKWLLKGVKPSLGLKFFIETNLHKMFPQICSENNWRQLGDILDNLVKFRLQLNAQEALALMLAGLLSLPDSKPLEFMKKWIPVNDLLRKVPAILEAKEIINLQDKNLCKTSLRRTAFKAGGMKLPSFLLFATENLNTEIQNDLQKTSMEMEIWENPPEPFLTGQMLLEMGLKQSPVFGKLIKQCFELQLDGKINCKEEARDWVTQTRS